MVVRRQSPGANEGEMPIDGVVILAKHFFQIDVSFEKEGEKATKACYGTLLWNLLKKCLDVLTCSQLFRFHLHQLLWVALA